MTIDALLKRHGIAPPRCGAVCPVGWLPLVDQLIVDLKATGWDGDLQQVKEKFGMLRFYVGSATEKQFDLIHKMENYSLCVCQTCGLPGRQRRRAWLVVTECDDCHKLG